MNQHPNLLEGIDWGALDGEVAHQQRNREVHSPAISLFRWWARRPHVLIGRILDEAPSNCRVSDPFSGGGTVAIEAARRDLGIYAQDLHPWAMTGLATALDGVDADQLERAGETWLAALKEERRRLYGTVCPRHKLDAEILTTFWARTTACPECDTEAYLYPYSMLTLASRRKHETHAFYGCNACGYITRSAHDVADRRCSGCRRQLADGRDPQLPGGLFTCRNRECEYKFPAFKSHHSWEPVLVQRLCAGTTCIDVPTAEEIEAARLSESDIPDPLKEEIPLGLETRRLLRSGFTRWADLYPARQLRAMLSAADTLEACNFESSICTRLRLALCGASEMAGHASRWDRFYPKAFEATANHRFGLTGLAAEVNVLADRGRGTLVRRVAHSVRAARWAEGLSIKPPRRLGSGANRLDPSDLDEPALVRGSSTRQLLPDNSVDLVLTDPPYYDDVQYAELGSLFLAWARAVGLVGSSVHVDFRAEAVPNSIRGSDTTRYCELLKAILTETARTLKPRGRAVLTFHNTDGKAWWALARALGGAGFYISALAVAHAENELDHSKRGRLAFSRDLVIECRLIPVSPEEIVDAGGSDGDQSRQLLAAGHTVAELAAELAGGEISRTRTYRHFGRAYRRHLGDAPSTYIRLGDSPG
jgi:putative DNA methylase